MVVVLEMQPKGSCSCVDCDVAEGAGLMLDCKKAGTGCGWPFGTTTDSLGFPRRAFDVFVPIVLRLALLSLHTRVLHCVFPSLHTPMMSAFALLFESFLLAPFHLVASDTGE